jgi:host factor-I protein
LAKTIDSSRGEDVRGMRDIAGGQSSELDDNRPGRETKDQPVEKLAQNIQEAFLNNARKEKTFLTIYLMSGVKLSGRIKSFDKYSVILETNNQEQLIFKHAISTVVVSKPFHSSPGPSVPGAVSAPGTHPVPGAPIAEPSEP